MEDILTSAINIALKSGSLSKFNTLEQAETVIVFGTGFFFTEALEQWKLKERLKIKYLCDNNPEKWEMVFYGIPCISPDELKSIPNSVVIPIVGNPYEIENQLDKMGINHLNISDIIFEILCNMPRDQKWFSQNRILDVYDLLDDLSRKVYTTIICKRIAPQLVKISLCEIFTDDRYFYHNFFPIKSIESFIDCGVYNGDTVLKFIKAVDYNFRTIHAFEFVPSNYKELIATVLALPESPKIICHDSGVWDNDDGFIYGKEEFSSGESFGIFKTDNTAYARTEKIDDLTNSGSFTSQTLIKMDIEGAEFRALKGAEKFISQYKPKLAICLYHRLEDFWVIPVYLKSIRQDYHFGIKHHQDGTIGGTVLYAW